MAILLHCDACGGNIISESIQVPMIRVDTKNRSLYSYAGVEAHESKHMCIACAEQVTDAAWNEFKRIKALHNGKK